MWSNNPGSLAELSKSRDNNYNLIRVIAAIAVLISHSYAIYYGDASLEPLRALTGKSLGSIAVDIFFFTSGFLITASLVNSQSLAKYFQSRVLRIYPALCVAIVLTTFVAGPVLTELSISEYFTSYQTWEYLIKNSILLLRAEYDLPGVFQLKPLGTAVNGSLWSLPYEIYMYITLATIGAICHVLSKKHSSTIYPFILVILALLQIAILTEYIDSIFINKFLYLALLFFTGSLFYLMRDKIKLKNSTFLLCSGLLVASILLTKSLTPYSLTLGYALILGYLTLHFAYYENRLLLKYNKLGDYSYGMYIYAFPIQQILANQDLTSNVYIHITMSFSLTLICAIISWHYIEKNALKLKSKLTVYPKNNAGRAL